MLATSSTWLSLLLVISAEEPSVAGLAARGARCPQAAFPR